MVHQEGGQDFKVFPPLLGGDLMDCISPIRITKGLSRKKYPDGLEVGCGKCYLCRIQRRREWKLRLWHENEYHARSSFLTLTYDEDNIPENNSLVKIHLQNFIKRIRSYQPGETIKHYSVGEYGEKTSRPHYHSILFGCNDRSVIESCWKCGFVSIGNVEPESIEYVAGYVDKKFYGDTAHLMYDLQGKEKPFKIQSNGIGKRYAIDHQEEIKDNKCLTMNGIRTSVPRYYMKVIGLESEVYDSKDVKLVKRMTGLDYSREEIYKMKSSDEIKKIENVFRKNNLQREKNIKAKSDLKSKKL